ncbi:hypothetical protein HK100_006827, partial [Physocladia obscura]
MGLSDTQVLGVAGGISAVSMAALLVQILYAVSAGVDTAAGVGPSNKWKNWVDWRLKLSGLAVAVATAVASMAWLGALSLALTDTDTTVVLSSTATAALALRSVAESLNSATAAIITVLVVRGWSRISVISAAPWFTSSALYVLQVSIPCLCLIAQAGTVVSHFLPETNIRAISLL